MSQLLPELASLEQLVHVAQGDIRAQVLTDVTHQGKTFPIHCLELGSTSPDHPVLVLCGGIHGLERIGTQVILAFLHSLVRRIQWDSHARAGLRAVRIVSIPLVNPVGTWRNTRANGQGVDLMRNAPINAEVKVPFLLGGHRFSRHLPWYRGQSGQPMETEARALTDQVRKISEQAPVTLILDCHSGFGFNDQIWFPYAWTDRPFEYLPEVVALRQLLDHTYPHHVYTFEPQGMVYHTHGDIWDMLALEAVSRGQLLIPLTMEMGSWAWARKNPRQLLRLMGFFHPVMPHRTKRVLRRHLIFLDFLVSALREWSCWAPQGWEREKARQTGLNLWYPDRDVPL